MQAIFHPTHYTLSYQNHTELQGSIHCYKFEGVALAICTRAAAHKKNVLWGGGVRKLQTSGTSAQLYILHNCPVCSGTLGLTPLRRADVRRKKMAIVSLWYQDPWRKHVVKNKQTVTSSCRK